MGNRSQLCSFPVEIAVRIIGTVTVIIYAFVFIFLCSGLEGAMRNVKIRMILAVDSWSFFRPQAARTGFADWSVVLCVLFSICYMISGTLLVCSSIKKQRTLTAPWLLCSTVNILAHLPSFALLAVHNVSPCDKWVTALSVFYTVVSISLWLVVVVAQYSWRTRPRLPQLRRDSPWEEMFKGSPPPATRT